MVNTELERQYLHENDFVKNEHGRFIYANRNGEHVADLEFILEDYYTWRKMKEMPYEKEIWIPIQEEQKKKWWQFWKINIKPAL
jgi:hypothetical protein